MASLMMDGELDTAAGDLMMDCELDGGRRSLDSQAVGDLSTLRRSAI